MHSRIPQLQLGAVKIAHLFIAVQQRRQLLRALGARQGALGGGSELSRPGSELEKQVQANSLAIQIHGGNGLAIEYGLADLWFIARLHKTAPVSREMILNFVAQHSLGLPKSY